MDSMLANAAFSTQCKPTREGSHGPCSCSLDPRLSPMTILYPLGSKIPFLSSLSTKLRLNWAPFSTGPGKSDSTRFTLGKGGRVYLPSCLTTIIFGSSPSEGIRASASHRLPAQTWLYIPHLVNPGQPCRVVTSPQTSCNSSIWK